MIFEYLVLFFHPVVLISIAFLVERYVLLEPVMEKKKQTVFYIVSLFASLFTVILGQAYIINPVIMFCVGLDIALGRKAHRLRGFFLVIPLTGLMIGLVSGLPNVLLVAVNTLASDIVSRFAVFIVYVVLFALLLIFYFKGKKWRNWFDKKMRDRRPTTGEHVSIIISGLTIFFMSAIANYADIIGITDDPETEEKVVRALMLVFNGMAFVMSLTVVIMIMQGHKRKLYHDRIEKMQFSVISTMADIVENRDENTGGHIKRTAKYVEIIGRKLRKLHAYSQTLTDEYLSDMIVAAPLHDIGKIHIPDAILNKAGRLTDEEFEIMKTHTTAGRDVLINAKKQLGDFNYINRAIEMAEYHHEWWNGKGYPNALSGNDIPLCARIMAVADVFDALTAKRCYKDAMPLEKAYSIIEEESGTHFDPVIAEAFLSSKKEIETAVIQLSQYENDYMISSVSDT